MYNGRILQYWYVKITTKKENCKVFRKLCGAKYNTIAFWVPWKKNLEQKILSEVLLKQLSKKRKYWGLWEMVVSERKGSMCFQL